MEYKTYIKKKVKNLNLPGFVTARLFHRHYRGILEATEWFRKILYKIVDRQDKSASP